MDSGKLSSNVQASTWGWFALVTYLPEPLSSFLTELRRLLPGDSYPDAHITFLPPRALSVPLADASLEVQQMLQSVEAFELSLGEVRIFPETKVVYLAVEAGYQELECLHQSLNRDALFAIEEFDYIPHLTLGGPLELEMERALFDKVQSNWKNAKLPPRFMVTEVVLLWRPGSYSERAWTRVASHRLQGAAVNSIATRT